jgi:hypothetical protein
LDGCESRLSAAAPAATGDAAARLICDQLYNARSADDILKPRRGIMRPETERNIAEIEQALALLRRHL